MTTFERMIWASFPTVGYEERPGSAEPIEIVPGLWDCSTTQPIVRDQLRLLEQEVATYGLTTLEPATVEEIDAAGRVSWETTLELMSESEDSHVGPLPKATDSLPPIPTREELDAMRRYISTVHTDLDRAVFFLDPPRTSSS